MNADNVYYPFIVSILSEKILEISQNAELNVNAVNNAGGLLYYNKSAPSQEDIDQQDYAVIGPDTAIEILLKEGADPFYMIDVDNILLSKVLLSSCLKEAEKELFFKYIHEEKLQNLSDDYSNTICSDLFYSGYLPKLMNKGLSFKQQELYTQQTIEIFALKQGEINFFKPMLSYDPFSINFDHVYTYKSDKQDIPPDNYEIQTTLRKEINKIIEINENLVTRNTTEEKSLQTAFYLSKAMLFQDLHNKLSNAKEMNTKNKI